MDEIASSHSRPRKGELLAANPSPSIAPEFANAIARDRVIPRLPPRRVNPSGSVFWRQTLEKWRRWSPFCGRDDLRRCLGWRP